MTEQRPVLIMAGGTGGHVFPALALARLLRERAVKVIWLGTQKGIEARVIPAEGIPIEWLTVGGLRGKSLTTLLTAPWQITRALLQALKVMRRHRPAVVVGLGGFVTGPGGIAAWLTHRPLLLHEQNAVAGFTNRVLSHFSHHVLEAFPGSFGRGSKARAIGNPVRRDIIDVPPPAERFKGRTGPLRILVIGGSQGAYRLNNVVPAGLAALTGVHFEVRHQAGEKWIEGARDNYAKAGVTADVRAFIESMGEAYGWADLVICRSGALTVSELAAVGVASILVPFPAATDDHQTHNARYLADAGAAVLIPEKDLTPERLAAEIKARADRAMLLAMAEKARQLAKPAAADDLAAACLRLAGSAVLAPAGGRGCAWSGGPGSRGPWWSAVRRPTGATACGASTPSTSSASAAPA
jgi:UDP-N-acetylglucosamine--N-acetylmuramyl-(pentapeptide) pyrophosphoryl-undecaprenol N-acetylglucosamine transferase